MDNKTNDKKIEKVVTGKTSVSKNTDPGNIMSKFIVEGVQTAGKSMLMDVFLPKCKQAVYDALINGLSVLFWGVGGVKKTSSTGTGTRVNYSNSSGTRPVSGTSQYVTPTIKKTVDPEDINFETRLDAQNVYNQLGSTTP